MAIEKAALDNAGKIVSQPYKRFKPNFKKTRSQNQKEALTPSLQLTLTPLPSRRVTSASLPLLAALISASSSGCVCACVCMTMLGAFLWWSGGVQG
jgi:hypothetical protein